MGKSKLFLSNGEKKFLIGSAYKTYLVEMYCMQKASETKSIKCDNCETVIERKLNEVFKDYETQDSIATLVNVIKLVEPTLWDKVKEGDTVALIRETIIYLTGVDMFKQEDIAANLTPTPAESDAAEAIQAKDLTDKSKVIVSKTIPKKPNLKISKK